MRYTNRCVLHFTTLLLGETCQHCHWTLASSHFLSCTLGKVGVGLGGWLHIKMVNLSMLTHLIKIQSEMVHFVPSNATWRTGRNTSTVFDSGPFAPSCGTFHHHPQNQST